MAEEFFRTELDALMYSVTESDAPMEVRYAGDGWWAAQKPGDRERRDTP